MPVPSEGVTLTKLQFWASLIGIVATLLTGNAYFARQVAESVVHEALAEYPSKDSLNRLTEDVKDLESKQVENRAVQAGFAADIANIKSSLGRIEDKLERAYP